jgi:hypothetical protein
MGAKMLTYAKSNGFLKINPLPSHIHTYIPGQAGRQADQTVLRDVFGAGSSVVRSAQMSTASTRTQTYLKQVHEEANE